MALITVDELDELTNSSYGVTLESVYLNGVISSISEAVEDYNGVPFLAQDILERGEANLSPDNWVIYRVRRVPLLSATSMRWFYFGNQETNINFQYADVDTDTNTIRVPAGYFPGINAWAGFGAGLGLNRRKIRVEVMYRAGYETVPDFAKMATALLVKEWLESDIDFSEGRPAPIVSYRSGSYSESYGIGRRTGGVPTSTASGRSTRLPLGLGTSLSQRAMMLLETSEETGVMFL